MTDFWSGNLLGTSRYRGTPIPKQLAIPELRPELFERRLQLFKKSTLELGNSTLQLHANTLAYRIASRLNRIPKKHYPDKSLLVLREV